MMYSLAKSLGLALILVMFYLVQTNKVKGGSLRYSLGNALGATLMLLGQFKSLQVTTLFLEILWVAISLYGLTVKEQAQ